MKNSSNIIFQRPQELLKEGGGESDRPLISGKQALIQEFLMADPLSRSHSYGRKTASINLAREKGERRFAKKAARDNGRKMWKVAKGRVTKGARTWRGTKRRDNESKKHREQGGMEKDPFGHPLVKAFASGEKNCGRPAIFSLSFFLLFFPPPIFYARRVNELNEDEAFLDRIYFRYSFLRIKRSYAS